MISLGFQAVETALEVGATHFDRCKPLYKFYEPLSLLLSRVALLAAWYFRGVVEGNFVHILNLGSRIEECFPYSTKVLLKSDAVYGMLSRDLTVGTACGGVALLVTLFIVSNVAAKVLVRDRETTFEIKKKNESNEFGTVLEPSVRWFKITGKEDQSETFFKVAARVMTICMNMLLLATGSAPVVPLLTIAVSVISVAHLIKWRQYTLHVEGETQSFVHSLDGRSLNEHKREKIDVVLEGNSYSGALYEGHAFVEIASDENALFKRIGIELTGQFEDWEGDKPPEDAFATFSPLNRFTCPEPVDGESNNTPDGSSLAFCDAGLFEDESAFYGGYND